MIQEPAFPFETQSAIPAHLANILFVLITLPHALYASVFFNAKCAKVLSEYHNLFMLFSGALKFLLVLVLLTVAFAVYDVSITGTPVELLGVGLLLFGLHLNQEVYKQLGTRGVYYGLELGALKQSEIVWVTGYPFSWFYHPQYFGSVLNWIAFICLCGFDASGMARWEVIGLSVYACTLYAITIVIETSVKVKL
jgi:steroid 5-alpha reductase family enzyme